MKSADLRAAAWQRYAVILSLLAAAILCALSLSHSALLLIDAPYDIYIPLDAGLRWLQGVFPSRDYPSPIGPLYAIIHGLALSFDSTDARSLVRADAAMLVLSYALLWPVLHGLAHLSRAVIIILLAGMMMTPLALDTIWHSYRYVADYNRWGWGFLAVVLVWVWNPAARGRLGQIALAVSLICLFYLKLTVFAGAVACLAVGILCDRRVRPYLLPVALTLAAIAAGFAAGFVLPYLADNIAAAGATDSLRWGKLVVQCAAPYNFIPTALAVAIFFNRATPISRRMLLLGTTGILHLTALQNFDTMVPLIGVPLLLASRHLASPKQSWCRPVLAYFPAVVQAAGLFLTAAVALISVPWVAAAVNAQPMAGPGKLGAHIEMTTEPPLDIGVHHGDLPFAGSVVYAQIGSAQQLLAGLPRGTRVATLEIANIAITLWPNLRPSPGALLWYDDNRSFSDRFYPPPREAFAGADVILVPLHFTTDSTEHLAGLYRPWLDRCATVIAANSQWRLYKPPAARGTGSPAPGDQLSSDTDCTVLARP